MTASPELLQLAREAIENEIRTYFPDTALYRRLCWGGFDRCNDYLHQEFSPDPHPARSLEAAIKNSSPGAQCAKTALPDQCSHASTPPSKRRRISIVEELVEGLRSIGVAHRINENSLHSQQTHKNAGEAKEDLQYSLVAVSSYGSTSKRAPFTVTCQRCTTRVTSAYACTVIKGYVVLWAESSLEVSCVPQKNLSAEAPTSAQTSYASSPAQTTGVKNDEMRPQNPGNPAGIEVGIPPLICLRPLLHRFKYGSLMPPQRRVGTVADVLGGKDGKMRKAGKRKLDNSNEMAEPITSTTQQLTLHSLHLVNDDAVTHVRLASFALQSVLQPDLPTALECYPRHMIHFGLLCLAAWRATRDTWRDLMGGIDRHEQRGPPDAENKTTNGHKEKRLLSLDYLVPHTTDDAVLILGLGGNVLGECLDMVLPSAVPLHTVEVEPAVLRACVEHHQFPPCSATPDFQNGGRAREGVSIVTDPKEEIIATASKRTPKRRFPVAPSDIWREVESLIHKSKDTALVFSSRRRYDGIPSTTNVFDGGIDQKVDTTSKALDKGVAFPSITKNIVSRRSCNSTAFRSSASPSRGQQSEYLCILQDAYAFLRQSSQVNSSKKTVQPSHASCSPSKNGMKLNTAAYRDGRLRISSSANVCIQRKKDEAANEELRSDFGERVSVLAMASQTPVQYSMIFLDCYDPDREHMMHEGGLIDLCARRLRPGGALLVNAHVLPTVANLERDFMTHGFATVQALRVSGCTQTILVCIAPDTEAGQADGEAEREEKCDRFTVRQLQQLAHRMNAYRFTPFSSSPHEAVQASFIPSFQLLRSGFLLDASWLKTCRRMTYSKGADFKSKEVDFRVWQHYF